MDCQLAGKRALVTGAASGIGKAIALALAREGATVATHARTAEKSAGTVDEITAAGGEGFPVAADLTDSGAIATMCANAIDRLGGIDIVVNNAGVCDLGKVEEMEESFWDWVIDTNLKAPFLVTKHTVPTLKQQGTGGALIYNASTNAKTADAEWSAYNTSKHGLIGFIRLHRGRARRARHYVQRDLSGLGRDADGREFAQIHGGGCRRVLRQVL